MIATLELSDQQQAELRNRFPYSQETAWVAMLARARGWQHANMTYLAAERKRSTAAMRHLMAELGIEHVGSVEQALDVLELAFQIFAPEGGFRGKVTRGPGPVLHVEVADCPVFEALEASHWHTVTACPSWHRRRGWLDALGVRATDTLRGEKKWGDRACATDIEVLGLTAA